MQSLIHSWILILCRLYGPYAMDVIGSCAFGLRVNSQTNQDEPFIKYAKRIFNINVTNPAFLISSE